MKTYNFIYRKTYIRTFTAYSTFYPKLILHCGFGVARVHDSSPFANKNGIVAVSPAEEIESSTFF